ncbi:MAG: hypothetical protein ABL308_10665 [Oceanicaulis sp.]
MNQMYDMNKIAVLRDRLPDHLLGKRLVLRSINSPTALRRDFRRWLREAPDYYYSGLNLAEGIARQVGKPQLVTITQDKLDEKVAEAALEMVRIAEAATRSYSTDKLNKAKAAWKADPVNNPGPDEDFGITVETDNPALVSITGTGSDDGDQAAWVAALTLADAYHAARLYPKELKRERDAYERHLRHKAEVEAVVSGKLASCRTRYGTTITSDGLPPKAKRSRRKSGRKARTVTPPSSSSASPITTLPRRWRDLSVPQRCGLMAQTIEAEGRGLSITIDLSEARLARCPSDRGKASYLQKALSEYLNTALGHTPDFLIVLEQGLGQKPHLHGVIDLEDTPGNRKAVRHAGEVLSGLPLDGPGRARIVDIQPLTNGAFWPGGYTEKYRRTTMKQMKLKQPYAHTRTLGQRAMAAHSALVI